MNTSFDTKADAIKAGFAPVNRSEDRDVSGAGSFGYTFERVLPNGKTVRTVDVLLRKQKNISGGYPSFIPMYPPQ